MLSEVREIKEIRKRLGLTQSALAKQAAVSQSLIAKIEANRIDPTYSKVQQIFQALDNLNKKREIKAKELMTGKIIGIEPDETIQEAIRKMKRHNISQMPVVKEHKSIGVVSETIILEALLQDKKGRIKDIMQDSPPVVNANSSIGVISNLLRFYPMVLVSEEGELKGVITKSDLLGKMYKG